MTRDEVIEIWGNANGWSIKEFNITITELERFAQLVAERERAKVAKWMIDRSYATGHGDTIEDLLKELEWQIREREREECAKIADDYERQRCEAWAKVLTTGGEVPSVSLSTVAVAIRARGEK